MADAKNTPEYQQGGEVQGPPADADPAKVGQNPTGWPRKSSARTRRKKDGKLFGGTLWGRKPKDQK